jgi:hypothetical protein
VIPNIVVDAEVRHGSGKAANLVKQSSRGKVNKPNANLIRAIAEVCVIEIDEVVLIHQSDPFKNFLFHEHAASRTVIHRPRLVEAPIIFSVKTEMPGRTTITAEVSASTPNLFWLTKIQNLRDDHAAFVFA